MAAKKLATRFPTVTIRRFADLESAYSIIRDALVAIAKFRNICADAINSHANQLDAIGDTGSSANVDDDAATSFTPTHTSGFVFVTIAGDDSGNQGLVAYDTTTPTTTLVSPTADVEVTTGVLAGTTGTDVKLTISAHTDGAIYIENRLGSTKTIRWTVIA